MSFLHGINVAEVKNTTRSIATVATAVIGLVATAPDALPVDFPLDVPVKVTNLADAIAKAGASGTLRAALDDSLPTIDDVPVDPLRAIGDGSAEHAALRLACLQEAREQAASTRMNRYADLLYRARLNARFVIEGRTMGLRVRNGDGA